jgi:hypothetical protein
MKRPCLVCGKPSQGSRCPDHGGNRRAMTTAQRGYGRDHQRRRAQLLPQAIGNARPLCGKPMRADEKLDLDHGEVSAMFADKETESFTRHATEADPRIPPDTEISVADTHPANSSREIVVRGD